MCENEADSEDDFEGYFLKPVNEYNIVDRIKDANKELFATPQPSLPSVLNRKVTFREILEDFEPNSEDSPRTNALIESVPEESDENEPNTQEEDRSANFVSTDCSKDNMSDCSDHEIDEICEEVDSLEVQDPNSDCEKSLSTEIDQQLSERRSDSPVPTFEHFSTSISSSSEDSPSIIQTSIVEEAKRILEGQTDEKTWQSHAPATEHSSQPKGTVEQTPEVRAKPHYGGDILKLRLNYKTCCEYKNSFDNLPRYSGYFSQYGLTKEQWECKEKRFERNRKKFLDKSSKTVEAENKKIEDNERAFTNWLRNKMRFPINKTKNMFDFKPNRLKRRKKQNEVHN